jgi:hypothetical protein
MNKRHVLRAVGTLVLAALASVVAGRPAQASEAVHVQRWLLGFDAVASTLNANDKQPEVTLDERANGPGLQVGWLLKPTLMLRVCAAAADHGTNIEGASLRVGGGTFDAVWLMREGQAFRPYLFAGAGGYQATSTDERLVYEVNGPGLAFGAGWFLRVRGGVSLHGELRVESVRWPEAEASLVESDGLRAVAEPLDRDGWGSKVMVGLAWWP